MVTRSRAKERLSELLERGRAQGQALMDRLVSEVPEDHKVPHHLIQYFPHENNVTLSFYGDERERPIHPHALGQMCQKSGVPKRYADLLLKEGQADLLAKNLNIRFGRMQPTRNGVPNFLMRSVGGEVRGFLSDRYRRWGSMDIIEAFAAVAQKCKAMPIAAVVTDTRMYVKVVLDKLFDAGKDFFLYGMCLQHSDFGDGALSMKSCLTRLVCDNGMLGEDGMRRIHLGARIGDDLELSERTYQLDTKTMASAVADVTGAMLQEDRVKRNLARVEALSGKVIDAEEKLEVLRKNSRIDKGEKEQIAELYRSAEVVKLPPGNTEWRLVNAISLFAQSNEPVRAMELEGIAGAMVGLAA